VLRFMATPELDLLPGLRRAPLQPASMTSALCRARPAGQARSPLRAGVHALGQAVPQRV